MADIHLIDGEKGGVGKSLFARLFLHFWLTVIDDEQSPVLFDTDASRKDVESFYFQQVECGNAYFSDDDEKLVAADEIFETALFGKPVVVNLGASVYNVVRDWIVTNDLVELGRIAGSPDALNGSPIFEALLAKKKSKAADPNPSADAATPAGSFQRVRFFKWFVCSGQQDSIDPFIESLKQLGHHIPHILVQNRYLYDHEQWTAIANSLAPQLSEYGVRSIYIPKLLKSDLKVVLEGGLTWEQAIRSPELTVMARQRLYLFCSTSIEQLSQIWGELQDSQEDTHSDDTQSMVGATDAG
jgi:hypothetical protein